VTHISDSLELTITSLRQYQEHRKWSRLRFWSSYSPSSDYQWSQHAVEGVTHVVSAQEDGRGWHITEDGKS
jgi:hypothetical protein